MPIDHNQSYLGVGDDGRHQFKMRQSTIKTLDTCAGRVKFEEDHPEECWESDAAAAGTAAHTGIEAKLTGEVSGLAGMIAYAENDFLTAVSGERFKWIRWSGGSQSEGAAIGFITTCLTAWYEKYGDRWDGANIEVEKHFDFPFYEDDERVIRLSGTMDLVELIDQHDENGQWLAVRPWDWKTASREYQEYQYRRWAVQPSAYTKACSVLYPGAELDDFTYSVMSTKGIQQFSVERGPGDWKFLERKVVAYAKMMERDAWTLNDEHDLCSPKWAPCWDSCKGGDVSEILIGNLRTV